MDEIPDGLPGTGESLGHPLEPDATALEIPRPLSQGARPAASEAGDDMEGRVVSHFRILGPLGHGAIGVVYKAEDLHLRRTVALKFLRPDRTRDSTAEARFLQEAQAASALDHPNICTIYEAREADGRLYLAMAHYEGETVKERIARGPLPVAEALALARQVAEGLSKAHRHGIVHRDIKPANLMVTREGVVKILDFGIAKLLGSADLPHGGPFLGSPAYMSPEQVRGEDVSFRTDVWSLGVVLFEMLTGARPFRMGGGSLDAVFHALLHDEAPPVARLRPDVPPELERIVAKMLAKAPEDRYPTAVEALADLAALHDAMTRPATGEIPAPDPRTGRLRLAAALIALAAAGGLFALRVHRAPRDINANFTQLTYQEGRELFPSLSPDGELLLYAKAQAGAGDIYRQPARGGNPVNLTAGSPADDTMPAFSPDGRLIAFRSERDGGGLYVMDVSGRSVRRIADFGFNPAWSPDGKEIAFATEGTLNPSVKNVRSQLWRVSLATGRRQLLQEGDAVQPSWSPGGGRIAYWGVPTGTGTRVIWTAPVDGGPPAVAVDDGYLNWNPVWSPDGKHLYYSSNRSGSLNLWRIPIDERTGAVRGEPEPIATPSASSGFLSLSADGRKIVYATDDSKANLERWRFDPVRQAIQGPGAPITQGSRIIGTCDLSPDNRWIAFHSVSPREDIFVLRADGSDMRPLTSDEHKDRRPRWSPDGSRIAFYSNRSGRYEIWMIRPDGTGLEQVTRTSGPPIFGPTWSPDGRQIAFNIGPDAAVVDLETRRIRRLPSATDIGNLSWSPERTLLAGETSRGIGVYSLASGGYETLVDDGTDPIWLNKSMTLLYLDGAGLKSIGFRDRRPRTLTTAPPFSAFNDLTVSTEDDVLYLVRQKDEGDIWMATLNP